MVKNYGQSCPPYAASNEPLRLCARVWLFSTPAARYAIQRPYSPKPWQEQGHRPRSKPKIISKPQRIGRIGRMERIAPPRVMPHFIKIYRSGAILWFNFPIESRACVLMIPHIWREAISDGPGCVHGLASMRICAYAWAFLDYYLL